MLVVSRYENERIVIEPSGIVIQIAGIIPGINGGMDKVKIGVTAPKSEKILREELLDIPAVMETVIRLREEKGISNDRVGK